MGRPAKGHVMGKTERDPGQVHGGPRLRPRVSLRIYIVVFVVTLATAATGGAIFLSAAATDAARSSALGDARFGAVLAARGIDDSVVVVQQTVAQTAANPAVAG